MTGMAEYIDREAAILALLDKGQCSRRYRLGEVWELNFDEIREAIADVPAADVRENVRGKWIEKEVFMANGNVDMLQSAFCPNCKRYHTTPYSYYFTNYAFCPHCGAQMVDVPDTNVGEFAKDTDVPSNADRIRAMSDEELAKTLWDYADGCPAGYAWSEACVMPDDCEGCWLDWLKSPVEVDDAPKSNDLDYKLLEESGFEL